MDERSKGVLLGAALVGAAWLASHYFGTCAACNLCLEAAPGQTVPPGVTDAVRSSARGYDFATYKIDADASLAWGWCLDGNGHHMSNWGFATQAAADADARKTIDGLTP